MRGLFVSFEGPEGCGKTTQIKLVAETLRHFGYTVIETREPGGCPTSAAIRKILLNPESELTGETELLLFAADRAQHLNDVILPGLETGAIVITDRYSDSTYAYQIGGRGLDEVVFNTTDQIATRGLNPDITFFLDIDVVSGLERASARNGDDLSESRFDSESLEFHKRIYAGYQKRMNADPSRFRNIDATQSVSDVCERIVDAILHFKR